MNIDKLIVFGGSFNPVHNGHVRLALEAQKFINADKLIVLPTNASPHKSGEFAEAFHRFNMCEIAFNKYDNIEVSDLEIKRGGISYTIDSLNQIKKVYTNSEIYLLVGSDMFFNINLWKDAKKIFKNSHICVACRTHFEYVKIVTHSKLLQNIGADIIVIEISPLELSSSEVRRKLKNNVSIKDIVPVGIYEYIIKNKLYV